MARKSFQVVDMKRYLFAAIACLLLISCQNKSKSSGSTPQKTEETASVSESPALDSQLKADTLSLENDAFMQEMARIYGNLGLLQQKLAPGLSSSLRVGPNIHYPEWQDTVHVLSFNSSEARVFKARESQFCQMAVIQDAEMPLPSGLRVGTDLKPFLEKTGFTGKARVYRLHSSEVDDGCYFTFMQGRLFRVDYLPFWD